MHAIKVGKRVGAPLWYITSPNVIHKTILACVIRRHLLTRKDPILWCVRRLPPPVHGGLPPSLLRALHMTLETSRLQVPAHPRHGSLLASESPLGFCLFRKHNPLQFLRLCIRRPEAEIVFSSLDLNGIDLTPVQDTPVASRKEDTYVHFNVDIELQKHVEKLTKGLWC